ncbi:MAG: tetraacyldisaccharide 4'-kinase [Flavobacteriales bacterium]|jgi:tetraacyldisaccharide 4'-kinase
MQLFRKLLFPFSWIYQCVVWFRNLLYDRGFFASQKGALPTIVVGNVHVGGTGKTPHTLWLANKLTAQFKLAILSRGYGRKTKGYLEWEPGMSADEFGDEPCQYVYALPSIRVVVCEDRISGISRISETGPEQFVLLDDALQHRKLEGNVNIVLMREDELPQDSHYLPSGNLRDHLCRLNQADVVIVTGAKAHWSNDQLSQLKLTLNLHESCIMSSSMIEYGALKDATQETVAFPESAIAVTGIANPAPFIKHLAEKTKIVQHFNYPDHYSFTAHDWEKWIEASEINQKIPVITTEKDFMRLISSDNHKKLTVLYNPIEVSPSNSALIITLIEERISPKQ